MLYASLSPGDSIWSMRNTPPATPRRRPPTAVCRKGIRRYLRKKDPFHPVRSDKRRTENLCHEGNGSLGMAEQNRSDAASVAYSDMFGCWSNDGGALAVWALPATMFRDAVVSVITFSDMQSRSCLVPLLGYVSAVNEEGTALIAAQYSDPGGEGKPQLLLLLPVGAGRRLL